MSKRRLTPDQRIALREAIDGGLMWCGSGYCRSLEEACPVFATRTIRSLEDRGLLLYEVHGASYRYMLTDEGRATLTAYALRDERREAGES